MSPSDDCRSILLVEDNPVDVDLTLRAFARRKLVNPFEIARDGDEAIGWIPRWEAGEPLPLVVLLDLKLPKINGLEVLQQYRAKAISRSIPIVVLTSSNDESDIEIAYREGANSYIVKPVNFDNFLEVATQIELYWCVLNEPPR